jgi:hypothetical protein
MLLIAQLQLLLQLGKEEYLVVLVIINTPFSSSLKKFRTKESRLQPFTTKMVVACKQTLRSKEVINFFIFIT